MITLQEVPVEQLQGNEEIKYCHILCCHPVLTLCGAYKAKKCNVPLLTAEGTINDYCKICNRYACPDCLDLKYYKCPGCP